MPDLTIATDAEMIGEINRRWPEFTLAPSKAPANPKTAAERDFYSDWADKIAACPASDLDALMVQYQSAKSAAGYV